MRAAPNVFVLAAGFVVAGTLILGLVAVGSPGTARELRFDQMRVTALINLSSQLNTYFHLEGTLPASLGADTGSSLTMPDYDPETGVSYEYILKSEKAYALCAVFTLPSSVPDDLPPQAIVGGSLLGDGRTKAPNRWDHAAGRHCFDFVAEGRTRKN